MDLSDQATDTEISQREAFIQAARRPASTTTVARREQLAEARLIAAQRGKDDPEVQELKLTCHNECGDPLSIHSDDIFCSKECAHDWQQRERAHQIAGR